jgi:hypothetical protein
MAGRQDRSWSREGAEGGLYAVRRTYFRLGRATILRLATHALSVTANASKFVSFGRAAAPPVQIDFTFVADPLDCLRFVVIDP